MTYPTARWHDWRKRAKDVWYQLRLLQDTWPDVMKAMAGQASQLSDLLGDDHDLAVLSTKLEGDQPPTDAAPVRALSMPNGHVCSPRPPRSATACTRTGPGSGPGASVSGGASPSDDRHDRPRPPHHRRSPVTLDRNVEIVPATGKLGVLLPGMGAVGTTFVSGVLAIRKGLAKPIGSLTQLGTIRLGTRHDDKSRASRTTCRSPDSTTSCSAGGTCFPTTPTSRRRAPESSTSARYAIPADRILVNCPVRCCDGFDRKLFMTIRQSRPRTNLLMSSDPWLRIDQLHASSPFFLQRAAPTLRRRIYRLRDLGHFPQHDGRAGRLLLWRQNSIEAWLADG